MAFGAVVSLTAVLLVFQYGQPRIFFAMARDGMLPAWAAKVHPKYRTPHITTVVTGSSSPLGSLVADENEIYDLTNIGTLVGVRARLHRRAGPPLQGSAPAAAVPRAVRCGSSRSPAPPRAST